MRKSPWLPHDEWKALHDKYLRSPQWADLRRQALRRDNNQCQICTGPAENVHHLTYNRWRHEQLFDLVSLCRACHKADHTNPRRAEATGLVCWMCGANHDPYTSGIYLAWWIRQDDNTAIDVGLFCNGQHKCRDLRDGEHGGSQMLKSWSDEPDHSAGPNYIHNPNITLLDLTSRGVIGQWALATLASLARSHNWTSDAGKSLIRATVELSAIPTNDDSPACYWASGLDDADLAAQAEYDQHVEGAVGGDA